MEVDEKQNLIYVLKGTEQNINMLNETKWQDRGDTLGLIDPAYDLGIGSLYLTLVASSLAAKQGKQAVAVGSFELDTKAKDFVQNPNNNILIYRIAKVWRFLEALFLAKHATEVMA